MATCEACGGNGFNPVPGRGLLGNNRMCSPCNGTGNMPDTTLIRVKLYRLSPDEEATFTAEQEADAPTVVGADPDRCRTCFGKGSIEFMIPGTEMQDHASCAVCDGTGKVVGGGPQVYFNADWRMMPSDPPVANINPLSMKLDPVLADAIRTYFDAHIERLFAGQTMPTPAKYPEAVVKPYIPLTKWGAGNLAQGWCVYAAPACDELLGTFPDKELAELFLAAVRGSDPAR